ncbi:MAG: hypothetical protein SGI87_04930 [Flavobacteriales bacterium]|nr:hypothetical protein [Flavobacteriales bacterium]
MNELKNKYNALRHQAVELMQTGNVNAYLSKLVAMNDVKLQLIQVSALK